MFVRQRQSRTARHIVGNKFRLITFQIGDSMKLYYAPGACSLAPHIVLRDIGTPFELIKVDIRAHQTQDGKDFYTLNPKGYVPVLELDNGERLTEGPVIAQYLCDKANRHDLM